MSDHLNADQLNGYIHQTLTDTAREIIDAHLNLCQLCRGQLADYQAVQRRVRYELLGTLNTLPAPASLTFATNRSRPVARAARGTWGAHSLRLAAGLIGLVVVVLAAGFLYATRPASFSGATPPASAGSRSIIASGFVGGWHAYTGETAHDYEIGFDSAVSHSGQASGYISATLSQPVGAGQLLQSFQPARYLGQRVRLSGYLKTQAVTGRAGLWLSLASERAPLTKVAMTDDRPVRGTTDWQPYDLVVDIPPDSIDLTFGAELIGGGQVWVDGLQLEIVSNDIAPTVPPQVTRSIGGLPAPTLVPATAADLAALDQPLNLSFENGLTGWSITGDTHSYLSGTASIAKDGQASGTLTWDVAQPIGLARLQQALKAVGYRGQRVRLAAQIKADPISQWQAKFFVVAYTPGDEPLFTDTRPVHGADWQTAEIVLDVPETVTRLEYGLELAGQGRARLDEVQVEVVGQNVPTTFRNNSPEPLRPSGTDLDGTFANWSISGSRPQDYDLGFVSPVAHSGQSSAHLKSIAPAAATEFGSLNTYAIADRYLGKRVRFSAYVKTVDVQSGAGLWLTIVGSAGEVLGYDNMQSRPIRGTSDWQPYAVVLDVPADSGYLAYGVLLTGQGEVWFDDVQLEVVGSDVPVTDQGHQQPLNLDFEITR